MRGERQLLRLGEYLVGRACRRLPQDIREERHQEWAAELPAILHDPQIRFAPRRAVRMLAFAADTVRGSATTPTRARHWPPRTDAAINLVLVLGLIALAGAIWEIVQAPGEGANYLQLAWSVLFVAWPVGVRVHAARRTTTLILIGILMTGGALNLWNAAQTPGDWVDYAAAAWFLLALPAWWFFGRRTRTRRTSD
jgi:hypothetical protein